MKKIAELNEKFAKFTNRNPRLELHVEALQKRVLSSDSKNQQTQSNNVDGSVATLIENAKSVDASALTNDAVATKPISQKTETKTPVIATVATATTSLPLIQSKQKTVHLLYIFI